MSATKKNHRLHELDATIVGDSPVVRELKNLILRAADSDSTVLITGESGTGKELIARSIHDLSSRRNEPFSAVNCGALTESLLESELFGHVKGAFTGANTYKKGLFEAAGKGTIFLDEFGEMSSLMQVRLLRVLQQRRVRPVGSEESKEIEIHARIVVATNRNLKRDIAEGRFRQDLYYRVNVLPIRSPALRNHIEDLPALIDTILKKLHANSRLAVLVWEDGGGNSASYPIKLFVIASRSTGWRNVAGEFDPSIGGLHGDYINVRSGLRALLRNLGET